ncbi:histamine N-methyltransferase-like [Saccoglossus kowalevskii]
MTLPVEGCTFAFFGGGQVDELIIDNLIAKYANITYIAVEPAAEELSKFKDLVEYKSDKWCNVTFDFQKITIEKYLEKNGEKQFGMVVVSNSAYHFKHLEDTTMKLYNCLVKGGMLYFTMGDGGWTKLSVKVGEYYCSSNLNFIGIQAIEDIFKRRLPYVKYQTKCREYWIDVTNCFDEESQSGSYKLDFFTQIYKFRETCKPEIKEQLLNYLRDECCKKDSNILLLNANKKDLIILRD